MTFIDFLKQSYNITSEHIGLFSGSRDDKKRGMLLVCLGLTYAMQAFTRRQYVEKSKEAFNINLSDDQRQYSGFETALYFIATSVASGLAEFFTHTFSYKLYEALSYKIKENIEKQKKNNEEIEYNAVTRVLSSQVRGWSLEYAFYIKSLCENSGFFLTGIFGIINIANDATNRALSTVGIVMGIAAVKVCISLTEKFRLAEESDKSIAKCVSNNDIDTTKLKDEIDNMIKIESQTALSKGWAFFTKSLHDNTIIGLMPVLNFFTKIDPKDYAALSLYTQQIMSPLTWTFTHFCKFSKFIVTTDSINKVINPPNISHQQIITNIKSDHVHKLQQREESNNFGLLK